MMSRTFLALVCTLLASCASGPVFQEAPAPGSDKALLYLMRPIVGGGSFWSTQFSINGTEVVTLTNNGYSWVILDAGTYEVSAQAGRSDPLRRRLVLRPGSTHYVEMRQGETVDARYTSYSRQDLLQEIPVSAARPVIEKMKYTPASNASAVTRT
jgi:hypothetical protein